MEADLRVLAGEVLCFPEPRKQHPGLTGALRFGFFFFFFFWSSDLCYFWQNSESLRKHSGGEKTLEKKKNQPERGFPIPGAGPLAGLVEPALASWLAGPGDLASWRRGGQPERGTARAKACRPHKHDRENYE